MPQDADEYYVFTDEKYQLQPPTNGRIKDLTRLQLRAPHVGTLSQKKQMARSFGWDPPERVDQGKEVQSSRLATTRLLLQIVVAAVVFGGLALIVGGSGRNGPAESG